MEFISETLKNILVKSKIPTEELENYIKQCMNDTFFFDIKKINTEFINNSNLDLTLSDICRVSYINNNRLSRIRYDHAEILSNIYDDKYKSYRYDTSIGSLLRRFTSLTDDEISKATDRFGIAILNQEVFNNFTFKIASTRKRIISSYNGKNYLKGKYTLNSSCMKSKTAKEYTGIYEDFGAKVLVCKYKGTNKICGRALLWENNSYGIPIMDRIYSYNYFIETIFILYAKYKGWLRKSQQSNDAQTEFVDSSDKEFIKNIEIKIPNGVELFNLLLRSKYINTVPYLDTFMYLTENGTLNNNTPNSKYEYLTLRHTDGTFYCSEGIVYLKYNSVYTIKKNAMYSRYSNTYFLLGDERFVEYNDDFIYKSDLFYSNYLNRYIFKDDAIHCEYLNDYLDKRSNEIGYLKYNNDAEAKVYPSWYLANFYKAMKITNLYSNYIVSFSINEFTNVD